ncbi:unnamed protein product, partial [Didymodactylos carnosus]
PALQPLPLNERELQQQDAPILQPSNTPELQQQDAPILQPSSKPELQPPND